MSRTEIWSTSVLIWAAAYTTWELPWPFISQSPLVPYQLWMDALISLLFVADIIFNLKNSEQSKHFMNYHHSKFYRYTLNSCNILACIPFDLIFYLIDATSGGSVLKVFRLARLIKINKVFSFTSIYPKVIKTQLISLWIFTIFHWITCGWLLVHAYQSEVFNAYVISLYWTITTLTTVGYGDIVPTTNIARFYNMAIMLLGVGFYALAIARITRFFAEQTRKKKEFQGKLRKITNLLQHYNVPRKIQSSIFNYYSHILEHKFDSNDEAIISDLPFALKSELQIYMNMRIVKDIPIFKGSSQPCLKAISLALKQESYIPEDIIIESGAIGDKMYIINHGTAQVILPDGTVINTLTEGNFFGEVSLIHNTSRSATVVTQTYCDVFVLEREDFLAISTRYPELYEKIKQIADVFYSQKYNKKAS